MIARTNINANETPVPRIPIPSKKVDIEWHGNVKIWKEAESRSTEVGYHYQGAYEMF